MAVVLATGGHGGNDDSKYVIYDANGKEMEDGSTTLKTTETTVKNSDIVKGKEYFLTWNTKSDGTGDKYNPGQEVKLGTKLYAIWGTHYINVGNAMNSAEGLGLTMTISDDQSEHKEGYYLVALSPSGEITITLSGWYHVYEQLGTEFRGKVDPEEVNDIIMWPELDPVLTPEVWVEGKTAFIKISYDNTCDLHLSLPYSV